MTTRNNLLSWARFVAVFALTATLTATALNAFAADISADSLKFGSDVMKAAGYETPPDTYVVANPTNVFANHFYYDTKVTGELKRGDKVETLAKVKGYEWVLVGKDGMGIGYVPISMLSPADKYTP